MSTDLHFLVVDDLPLMRYVIINLLRGLGYAKVSEADNGEQALKLLQAKDLNFPINFVVTDWNMPVMNGFVLLQKIRENSEIKHLPVLIVTAEANKENIIAAAQAGADSYIVKPLSAQTLKDKLDRILTKRKVVLSH